MQSEDGWCRMTPEFVGTIATVGTALASFGLWLWRTAGNVSISRVELGICKAEV